MRSPRTTESNFSRTSRPDRRQKVTSQVEAGAYHEAGRLIFCLYFGVPVESITYTESRPKVNFRLVMSNRDQQVSEQYYQIILSGEVAVKRFLAVETLERNRDQIELASLFSHFNSGLSGNIVAFNEMMAACRRRVIIHMADPKMASAIRFTASYIQGENSDVIGRRMDALLRVVYRMLTVT
jgi:hypothetical protein